LNAIKYRNAIDRMRGLNPHLYKCCNYGEKLLQFQRYRIFLGDCFFGFFGAPCRNSLVCSVTSFKQWNFTILVVFVRHSNCSNVRFLKISFSPGYF